MLLSIVAALVALLSCQNEGTHGGVQAQEVTERNPATAADWRSCRPTCLTTDALDGECEPAALCSQQRRALSAFNTTCEHGLGIQSVCCPWKQQERSHRRIRCGRLCRTTDGLYGTCRYRSACPQYRRKLTTADTECTGRWGFNGKYCCPFSPKVSDINLVAPSKSTVKPSQKPPITTPPPKPSTQPPPTPSSAPPPKPSSQPLRDFSRAIGPIAIFPATAEPPPPADIPTQAGATPKSPRFGCRGSSAAVPPKLKFNLRLQRVSDCGKTYGSKLRGLRRFIFGGQPADRTGWPWMVVMERWSTRDQIWVFHCGGTLIDKWHVLTAAHCMNVPRQTTREAALEGYHVSSERYLKLTLGVHDRGGGQGKIFGVARIFEHPLFKPGQFQHDIAVLRMRDPVRSFGAFIRPICLPATPTGDLTRVKLTVAGWGKTKSKSRSEILREVNVCGHGVSDCEKRYKRIVPALFPGGFGNSKLCCSWPGGGRDACLGDSGGPLVLTSRGGRRFLVGVVSSGEGCAQERYPGIYTRVSAYLAWIRSVTRPRTWPPGSSSIGRSATAVFKQVLVSKRPKGVKGSKRPKGAKGPKRFWIPEPVESVRLGKRRNSLIPPVIAP